MLTMTRQKPRAGLRTKAAISEAELTGMTEAMAHEGELGSGCAMYGQSPLGKPYVANGAAPQALPEKSAKKLQSVCPSVYAANGGPQGLWCCDPSQVDLLATKLALLHEVVLGCPACDHNFKHLWCSFTCSPHQMDFAQ